MTESRRLTLAEACRQFPFRITCEHAPTNGWHRTRLPSGGYPAPQYTTDREWYDATVFPGERRLGLRRGANARSSTSTAPTWPLGEKLTLPFDLDRYRRAAREVDPAAIAAAYRAEEAEFVDAVEKVTGVAAVAAIASKRL